ncbi:MAG TPA: T9SS type A sorting domain-containing protein, partial [Lentimicrobium sp.]|nr:T9SS type A sorting domain-containing protein [Lentimicrobium sp.]
ECFQMDIDPFDWNGYDYAIKGAGGYYFRGIYVQGYTITLDFTLNYFKKGNKKYGIPFDYGRVMGWWPFNYSRSFYWGRNQDNTFIAEEQIQFNGPTQSHISASYNTIGLSDETCWTDNKIGIFGKDILTDNRGTYRLINNNDDTIVFKAYTSLNQEWLFYKNDANNLVIKAKCKTEESGYPFWKFDSIRSYSFQAYDLNGTPIDHPVNSKEIRMSKNVGFLSTFDFYYFPDSLDLQNYTLNGYYEWQAEQGKINRNLTLPEVYGMKVGDRIDLVNTTTFEGGQTVTETIKYVIGRTGSTTSLLTLDFRVLSKIITYYDQGDSTVQYLQDTITQIIDFTNDFTAQFNKEVGNIMEVDGGYKIAHLEKSNQLYNGRLLKEINPVIFTNNDPADSCMNATKLDCAYYYINNLGGPYEKCTNAAYSSIDRLIAFQSPGSVWGSPLSESDVLGIEKNDPVYALIAVYPNPAKDILNISISDFKNSQWNFEIYNAYGMQIMSAPLSKTNNEINIEKFASGVYIYRIINEQGSTEGKF